MMRLIIALLEAILRDERKIVALLERLIAQLTGRPTRLVIEGVSMDVIVGSTAPFTVTCFDGESPPVAIHDSNGAITVSVDANGSATVNADGTGGVFTGTAVGAANLTATDGVLHSAPFAFNVVANPALAPASLVVTSP